MAWGLALDRGCGAKPCPPGGLSVVDTMAPDGTDVVEVAVPPDFFFRGVRWSPDGHELLLSSLDGVRAVPLDPSVPPTVYERHELDLEWSWDQISWQPMVP